MQRVLVTGVGVVSSLGLGREEFYQSLADGRSGIAPVERFDAAALGRTHAGEVKAFHAKDHLTAVEARRMGRCSAMALAAARMAIRDAGISTDHLRGPRTAVVIGTTMGEAEVIGDLEDRWIRHGAAAVRRGMIPKYGSTLLSIHVARAIGAEGMVLTFPAACAAGNYAIGFAADLIRFGRADVVVTGAAEIIQELQFSGFVRLAAMAPERCQPFDLNRQGLLLGEGAGLLVLESEAHAARRNAAARAEVGGYGLTCDAYHITRPHPDAAGSISAMRQAISRSGLTPDEVDFVNAHGTGTHHNDIAEAKVMREVFGRPIPVSSMKSMIGHCMGAASALEAVGCIMTLETGVYPPTLGYETPDPECNVDVVANVARREQKANVVVNNSLAFGGYNAVTCFARPDVLPHPKDVSKAAGRGEIVAEAAQ